MKNLLLILSIAGALSIHAQNAQVTPTTRPTTQPGTVTPPPGSSVTVAPNPNNPNAKSFFVAPFSNAPGNPTVFISNKFNFSNQFTVAFSNNVDTNGLAFGVSSNLDLTGVDGLLGSLQLQIDETLSVLVSLTGGLNANGGSVATARAVSSASPTIPAMRTMPTTPTVQSSPGSPAMPQMPTTPTVQSSPRSPAMPQMQPMQPIPGGIAGVNNGVGGNLPATGTANQRILAQSQIAALQGQGVLATLGTNTFVMNPQTFRVLTALQNNLLQARSLLQALNVSQGSQALPQTQTGVGFTNLFVVVTNNFSQEIVTPTGR